jgi:hypothetical protein
MPAGGIDTYSGNPNLAVPTTIGYKMGLDDVNGAACVNDPVNVPNPPQQPTAPCWNTMCAQLVSHDRGAPAGGFGITAGPTPTFAYWFAASGAIMAAAINPYAMVRVGAGNYQFTWAPGTFPLVSWPAASLVLIGGNHTYGIQAAYISNGVQVTTQQDGALTDLNFSVRLF